MSDEREGAPKVTILVPIIEADDADIVHHPDCHNHSDNRAKRISSGAVSDAYRKGWDSIQWGPKGGVS